MEPTKYQKLAYHYCEKFEVTFGVIQDQIEEISTLKSEMTELRRANYRLRDAIAETKQEKVCV